MIDWILSNKEWVFSGIGVFIIGGVITFILNKYKEKPKNVMKQKSGKKSKNYQAGGDINIGKKDE